jgi:ectoine hydroxylase-related dioxygenase (phytanoyl-CoA dioxygenase family)
MLHRDIPRRYGVAEQTTATSDIDYACESLHLLGYAIVDCRYSPEWLESLSGAFDRARERYYADYGGIESLCAIDEQNTIRLPLVYEPIFLELATNSRILEICNRMISGYVILNQQNGVINPPNAGQYNQGAWHRDLPYQHFVSSRPLAINALFCLDPFTLENGATKVLPASHHQEPFPSDHFVDTQALTVTAPAGSFIVLDCMIFHTGGVNLTERPRRAVNHVYSIPLVRQQIDLPRALGDHFMENAKLRKLLGYELPVAHSVAEYLASRHRK